MFISLLLIKHLIFEGKSLNMDVAQLSIMILFLYLIGIFIKFYLAL